MLFCFLEAVVKGEKQHANKYGDQKKDVTKLQQDTIKAVTEKEEKRHLHERIGSGGSTTKPKKR